jgi:hypothetical protein
VALILKPETFLRNKNLDEFLGQFQNNFHHPSIGKPEVFPAHCLLFTAHSTSLLTQLLFISSSSIRQVFVLGAFFLVMYPV